ncbi:ABC transporter substrate-binding protein [Jidongwangia harbinensis]|uniref:ABC transporter substrate-binding protein n=1 Tax=Jidongwangia harbinensis TaxID=2878561 RepID=UPI001CD95434|nr:ABC transporter substrate-binding protein [Jidongwangia harbinensis]MCA2218238.1 ABC transporter substrate-binding protein [Jidongwangia harbinensis]
MRTRLPRPRRLAPVCLAVAVALTAAGCGSGDDPASGGTVELRFGWWGNADRAAATQKVIAAFQAEHPTIKVKGETTDFNAYFDKLATEVAAGGAPDIITLGGAYPREYGDRGALLDIAKVGDRLKTDRIDAAALGNGTFDNVQYGVPSGVNAISAVLNPALFQAAKVPLPDTDTWTWDDYQRIARELAVKLPAGRYAVADPTRTDMLDVFSRQRGEALYTADGKVGISTRTLTDWWTMTTALRDAKASPPAATTAELQGQPAPEQSLMGRGLAAMAFDWSNQAKALTTAAGQPLELHRVPGESTAAQPGQWLQASQIYSINARTRHQKEAATFVDFLVNSPAAGRIILTDRGIPANSQVRAAILPALSLDESRQVKYIEALTPKAGPPLVIGPTGSTDTPGILDRLNVDVLFGRTAPAAAAEDFVKQVRSAIKE